MKLSVNQGARGVKPEMNLAMVISCPRKIWSSAARLAITVVVLSLIRQDKKVVTVKKVKEKKLVVKTEDQDSDVASDSSDDVQAFVDGPHIPNYWMRQRAKERREESRPPPTLTMEDGLKLLKKARVRLFFDVHRESASNIVPIDCTDLQRNG